MNWEEAWKKSTYFNHRVCTLSTEVLVATRDQMDPQTIHDTIEDIRFYMERSRYASKRWLQAAEMSMGLRGSKRTFVN